MKMKDIPHSSMGTLEKRRSKIVFNLNEANVKRKYALVNHSSLNNLNKNTNRNQIPGITLAVKSASKRIIRIKFRKGIYLFCGTRTRNFCWNFADR